MLNYFEVDFWLMCSGELAIFAWGQAWLAIIDIRTNTAYVESLLEFDSADYLDMAFLEG